MVCIEEHEFVDVSGHNQFYLEAGPKDGPLMVLIHGWPALAVTWTSQLETFANLGYRVVAPDMPGYGRTSIGKEPNECSLEVVNKRMFSLLEHCEQQKAVWVGHDWGAVAVWAFAEHYPEQCVAVACLARPGHTMELGKEELCKHISREVYPVEEYPYGQYDYIWYYERSFDKATEFFDSDPEGVLRALYLKAKPEEVGKPGITASVNKNNGWFGGASSPPSKLREIPFDAMCVDETMFAHLVEAYKKTGFRGADLWYINDKSNLEYFQRSEYGGHMKMPTLFVGANWDPINDIAISTVGHAQREFCENLTEVHIDAGHWVALEQPFETNAAIAGWLMKVVPQSWPFDAARYHSYHSTQ